LSRTPFGTMDYVKYPFLPGFEEFLKLAPSIDSEEIRPLLEPTKLRILGVKANRPLEFAQAEARPVDWGLSFYLAALVLRALGDPLLLRRFARVEALRVRQAFERDMEARAYRPTMLLIVNQLFRLDVVESQDGLRCSVPLYLRALAAMPSVPPELKLVNRPLEKGKVRLSEAELIELIRGRWFGYILSRLMAMPRPQALPEQIRPLYEEAEAIASSLAAARPRPARGGYDYIERLLDSPVSDGRHRLVWLVITPYLVNVKGLEVDEATAHTIEYLRRSGWSEPRLERLARYHSERAKRIGLKPPKLSTLKARDPQLYEIIAKAIGLGEGS
jgi:hypothetical protein